MSRDAGYRRLVGSKRWAMLAREMKERAGWKCGKCGKITQRLAVHHIVPVETGRTFEEMAKICFDVDNCRPLCFDCHAAVHKAHRITLRDVAAERQRQKVERFIKEFTNEEKEE
ncbi:MAG: HNH endonuclease [Bacteroidales bacterium]|nr:HNH endonuclease [Bacteroidales bacterium]